MDFASHRGITFILIARSAMQIVCLFDVISVGTLHSLAKISVTYNRNISIPLTKYIRSDSVVEFSCTIIIKMLPEEENSR